ncbi:MAG TPA: hypothetical protein VEK09_04490, partial [Jatrophihabitantaceae bacterium]|nr:hypothetical protein [Jatrophihabitantaceae bacterium]
MPSIATNAATPSVAPIWRIIICAPRPVARRVGGRVEIAAIVKAGSTRPTPAPPTSMPGNAWVAYLGCAPICQIHHRQP